MPRFLRARSWSTARMSALPDLYVTPMEPEQLSALSNGDLLEDIHEIERFLADYPLPDDVHASAAENLETLRSEVCSRVVAGEGPFPGTSRASTLSSLGVVDLDDADVPKRDESLDARGPLSGALLGTAHATGAIVSPPVSFRDAFRTTGTRLRRASPRALGFDPKTGIWTIERYAGTLELRVERPGVWPRLYTGRSPMAEMVPRYLGPEGERLRYLEYMRKRGSIPPGPEDTDLLRWVEYEWRDPVTGQRVMATTDDLARTEGLVRRMVTEGVDALGPADRATLRAILDAHATWQQVYASPVLSGTVRLRLGEILADLDEAKTFLSDRSHIVVVEMPADTVVDANRVLARELKGLHSEVEVLMAVDARRYAVAVRPNPTGNLARWAPKLRVLGWIGVAGSGLVSAYRLLNASDAQRSRMIAEEVGAQLGGWLGGALGVGACLALGPLGAAMCGLMGGVLGGVLGATWATGGSKDDPWVAEPPREVFVSWNGETHEIVDSPILVPSARGRDPLEWCRSSDRSLETLLGPYELDP